MKSLPLHLLSDTELSMRALRKGKLANHFTWVKDGAEALEFIFCSGKYAGRPEQNPKLILLDLKLPKAAMSSKATSLASTATSSSRLISRNSVERSPRPVFTGC